jgi:hypothetical protein
VRRGDALGDVATDRALDQVADGADRLLVVDEDGRAPWQVIVLRRRALRDVLVERGEDLLASRLELRPGGGALLEDGLAARKCSCIRSFSSASVGSRWYFAMKASSPMW